MGARARAQLEHSIVYTGCSGHNVVEVGSSDRIVGVDRSGTVVCPRQGEWGGRASSRCRSKVEGHDCDGGGLCT